MTTVLLIDDEIMITEPLARALRQAGYDVQVAHNGRDGLTLAHSQQPDAVLLDVLMPLMDGWEVCRALRRDSTVPILMLTARDDDIDKIVGLEMGADDYLTKPFNPRELVARVRAILRRTTSATDPTAGKVRQAGNVIVDPSSHLATIAGKRIDLRTKEFDLLITLMDHLNMVLSRDQLLDLVWGYEFYGRTRTVDVHIANLREKLTGSSLTIETIWGKGYKLITVDS